MRTENERGGLNWKLLARRAGSLAAIVGTGTLLGGERQVSSFEIHKHLIKPPIPKVLTVPAFEADYIQEGLPLPYVQDSNQLQEYRNSRSHNIRPQVTDNASPPRVEIEEQGVENFRLSSNEAVLNLENNFMVQYPGEEAFEAQVIPHRSDKISKKDVNSLFEDWAGKLTTEDLQKMFPDSGDKYSYEDLKNVLQNWQDNSANFAVSVPEPQNGRTAVFCHSGITKAKGEMPCNVLRNIEEGGRIELRQDEYKFTLKITRVLTVTEKDMVSKEVIPPGEKDAIVHQDIYNLFLENIQVKLESGIITQEEFDLEKSLLDHDFSAPGIDFVACETSGDGNGFDLRTIVSTVVESVEVENDQSTSPDYSKKKSLK